MSISQTIFQYCQKNALTRANVARCAAYFKDCSRFFSPADPLYSIANIFSSAVDLNFATVDVNGIPYYPINEEGSVGIGVLSRIPFGSWGGGYSDHVGIRDYWSQYQEAGGNWYEGKYGYKNGWSVPLVQSLGVEGGQHNTASVPLDPQNVGNVMVDNGYGVGGYYGHNDHVGENWRKGEVVHNFGVGAPFVGAGVNTGQAITFPSLDTFLNAGRK
uniref:Ntox44 domain-containing protein n=1 Tax=Angiostrongylus cantonensis TaxID=6313 RepID=A0A0K0DI74_ANGCA